MRYFKIIFSILAFTIVPSSFYLLTTKKVSSAVKPVEIIAANNVVELKDDPVIELDDIVTLSPVVITAFRQNKVSQAKATPAITIELDEKVNTDPLAAEEHDWKCLIRNSAVGGEVRVCDRSR